MKIGYKLLPFQVLTALIALVAAWQQTFTLRIIGIAAFALLSIVFLFIVSARAKREHEDADRRYRNEIERNEQEIASLTREGDEMRKALTKVQEELSRMKAEREANDDTPQGGTSDVLTVVSDYLKDKGKVLPILANQLVAVIEQTESAAMSLTQSFLSIHAKANSQVKKVTDVFGSFSADNEEEDSENVLLSLKDMLASLVGNFKTVTVSIRTGVRNIIKITENVEQIKDKVDKIDEISDLTKILALNAGIEAARAGAAGKGFAVVAGEVEKLAARANLATSEIHDIVNKILVDSKDLYEETQKEVNQSDEITNQVENMFESALEQINTTIEKAHSQLRDLTKEAESLAEDTSSIVISMQFQDITKQRIEHVIAPINDLTEEIEEVSNKMHEVGEDKFQLGGKSVADWLTAFYTMESEKHVLYKTILESEDGGEK